MQVLLVLYRQLLIVGMYLLQKMLTFLLMLGVKVKKILLKLLCLASMLLALLVVLQMLLLLRVIWMSL